MSFIGDFLNEYDRHLDNADKSGDVETYIYYKGSRERFLEYLTILEQESFASMLEVGPSELSFIVKKLRPALGVAVVDQGDGVSTRCQEAGVKFYRADVLRPLAEIEDESFDVVLFCEVVEHLQGNPRIAFNELFRITKPGGRVIISSPNLARMVNRGKLLLGKTPLERIGPPGWAGHFREYLLEEMTDFVTSAGFTLLKGYHPMYWDNVSCYMASGIRGKDDDGTFYYRPRFRGTLRIAVFPLFLLMKFFVFLFPGLRNSILVEARRPPAGSQ